MKKLCLMLALFCGAFLAAENVLPAASNGDFGIWSDYAAAR